MTTLALNERITFAGVDLASYATLVNRLSQWDEFPALRGDNPALTGLPGRQFLQKLMDARQPSLGLIVTPLTAAGADGVTQQRQARANLDALYQAFAVRGQQALVRRMPDASNRTAMAEVLQVSQFDARVGGRAMLLMVTFDLADPFFYGDLVTPSAVSLNATTKTFATTSNPGTASRSRRITFDITGPCANVRISNDTTGTWFLVPGSVAGTKHLIVNPYDFTAVNDGADVNGLVQHSGNSPAFLEIAPGVNNFTLTCTTIGGSLSFPWQAAYL